jgi:hypothetical protein
VKSDGLKNLPEDTQDRRSRLSWRPVGQPHEVFAEFSVNLKDRAMLSFQLMEFVVLTGLSHDIETSTNEKTGKDADNRH